MKICVNHPQRRAVNMRHELCNECNFKRTHNGKSQYEVSIEKRLISINKKKNVALDVAKPIKKKKRSQHAIDNEKKQFEIKRLLRLTYEEIDNEREHICDGCGTNRALCHSHIISQKDCKLIGKPELIYHKNNIHYHCMSPVNNCCNQKWESKDHNIMSQLLDYESNIAWVKSQSIELYNIIVNK